MIGLAPAVLWACYVQLPGEKKPVTFHVYAATLRDAADLVEQAAPGAVLRGVTALDTALIIDVSKLTVSERQHLADAVDAVEDASS